MKISRHWVGLMMVCLACGDDSSGGDKPADGSVATNSDGAVANPRNDAGSPGTDGGLDASLGRDGGAFCQQNPSQGRCTQAEIAPYEQCVQNKCASKYAQCFGADYLSGKFGGACETFLSCVSACGCTNTTCIASCAPSAECQTCLATDCDTSSCTEPSCLNPLSRPDAGTETDAGSDGGSSTATSCEQLTTCCNSITDATTKMDCLTTVSTAPQAAMMSMGSITAEMICGFAYTGYKTTGDCQ